MRLRRKATETPTVASTVASTEPEAPCIPCGQQREVRQFSLNTPGTAIDDADTPVVVTSVETEVGDDAVSLTVEGRERTYELNPTAGMIWLSIDGTSTVAQIIEELHGETGAPADVIGPDVRSSLNTFLGEGLISMAEVSSST